MKIRRRVEVALPRSSSVRETGDSRVGSDQDLLRGPNPQRYVRHAGQNDASVADDPVTQLEQAGNPTIAKSP